MIIRVNKKINLLSNVNTYKESIWSDARLKLGELLENPTIKYGDNQQPSLSSNTFEGSTTNSQIQTDNAEDGNANTSAQPSVFIQK